MRTWFFITVLITLVFTASHWYARTAYICPIPLSYRLGEVDERFGVERADLEQVLRQAEAVWEEGTGRDLFEFDSQGDLTVSFIFDERQQLASTEEEWRVRLDRLEAEYEAVVDGTKQLGSEYESKQASYDLVRERYDVSLEAHNAEVESYNQTGGAPASEFARLEARQSRLAAEARDIIALEQALIALVQNLNQQSDAGNALIANYNDEVAQYNELFGNRDAFTQGEYRRSEINIYKFSDFDELTRVITHEFGHALGIGHVEDEAAIMYYLMSEQTSQVLLSTADEEAFMAVCGAANSLPHQVRGLLRTILSSF